MSREKQGYRETIEELNRMFPNQGTLGKGEAAKFLGVSVKTLNRHGIKFSKKTGRVTKADLASQVCI